MCWIGSQGEPRELQVIEQALCSFVRVGDKKRPNQSFQRTRQSAPLNSNVRSLNTLTVVLDTNCIAEDGEARAEAISVRVVADAHSSGTADVRLVAISASERQKSGGPSRDVLRDSGPHGLAQSRPLAASVAHDVLGRNVLG